MAFSVWEYLRERARDATLAGIQDAIDIAEEGDPPSGQRAMADRLTARLSGQAVQPLPAERPAISVDAVPPVTADRTPAAADRPTVALPAGRPFGGGLDEPAEGPAQEPDPFEKRLTGPTEAGSRRGPSVNGERAGPNPPAAAPGPRGEPPPERRKRGRPRKDQGG